MTTPAQGGTGTPDAPIRASGVRGILPRMFGFDGLVLQAVPQVVPDPTVDEIRERDRERRARARALLRSFLTDEQRKSMDEGAVVDVIGSEGTHYRVHTGWYEDNIRWFDKKGDNKGGFCCHPRRVSPLSFGISQGLPLEDLVLGQILALRTDEKYFLRMAVRTWGEWPPVAFREEEQPVMRLAF